MPKRGRALAAPRVCLHREVPAGLAEQRGQAVVSTGAILAIAVPAAIAGAAGMGLASATQARAAKQVPISKTLHPRLLLDLGHRPLWLIGIVATITGLSLQMVALGFGPLLLVQPLLVTALPFACGFTAWLAHRRLDRVIVIGSLTCVAGLSAFLLLARPSGGSDQLVPVADLIPLTIVLGAITLGGFGLSALARGTTAHALGLAVATGVTYGVTAGLMKVVASQFRIGLTEPFRHWTLYVVCVVGPVGFLLSQNTFQQGKALSPALSVITTVDPLVGVAIGVWWMGESAATGPAVLTGEIIAATAIVAGIAILAHRSERLALVHEASLHRVERSDRATAPDDAAEVHWAAPPPWS